MKTGRIFLEIAKDEVETLSKYQTMLDDAEEMSEEEKAIIDEIMADEFNHCIVATLSAARSLGIKIATDDLSQDPNNIEVE